MLRDAFLAVVQWSKDRTAVQISSGHAPGKASNTLEYISAFHGDIPIAFSFARVQTMWSGTAIVDMTDVLFVHL